jgi:hypothetical protein
MDENQFSRKFEDLLEQQYAWLINQGFAEVDAAVAVHSAVLVLSSPGLRAEAQEQKVPLELVECRAIQAAAEDISENYDVTPSRAFRRICAIVTLYAE